jgi:hypothetical protein
VVHCFLAQPIRFGVGRTFFAKFRVYEVDDFCAFLLDLVNGFVGRGVESRGSVREKLPQRRFFNYIWPG